MEELITAIILLLSLIKNSSSAPHLPRFSSHVSFSSPASSFSHGVGDLHHSTQSSLYYDNFGSKPYKKQRYGNLRSIQRLPNKNPTIFKAESIFIGYPSEKPLIPFPTYPSLTHGNSLNHHHQHSSFNDNKFNDFGGYNFPVLPPSPYMVDSPNAESLWPEGLFAPPTIPFNVQYGHDKSDKVPHDDENSLDPYLLQGIEAVEALERLTAHGELFHHEIPHIRALLANQQLRLDNGLHPNRLGSIRKTSPWYRP